MADSWQQAKSSAKKPLLAQQPAKDSRGEVVGAKRELGLGIGLAFHYNNIRPFEAMRVDWYFRGCWKEVEIMVPWKSRWLSQQWRWRSTQQHCSVLGI